MADDKIVVMESGTENRTITRGVTPDGKAYVRDEQGRPHRDDVRLLRARDNRHV